MKRMESHGQDVPASGQGAAARCAWSNRAGPRPDERGLHTPPAKTTRRGAIHELVGVAGPLPARSPLPPRQLPERKAVLCVGLEYLLVSLYVGAEFLGSSRDDCHGSFVKLKIRVPQYLPKVSVWVLKITRIATPKGIVSILYDHRSCFSSLLHDCIDFLF